MFKNTLLKATVVASLCLSGQVFAASTINGVVKFEGQAPAMAAIKMDADPVCVKNNEGKEVKSEALVLGDGNTLGNIFVRVKSGLPSGGTYTAPTEPVVLDQKGCMYAPRVVGLMVGQPIEILNSDGTLHNVHGFAKANPEFNDAMPKFKKKIDKKFSAEEVLFPVKCDVHPWMQGYIGVVSHPFFAVTKADGKFSLQNLPAGKYEIEAWHEKMGTQVQTVEIKDGETKDLSIVFKR